MHLTLVNFRAHKFLELTIDNHKITNLSGNNGAGKSTILNAIYWCLYGKLDNVNPNTENTKLSTKVKIIFEDLNLTIYRQNNSNLFQIQHQDLTLVGDAAQAYIDNLFGTIEMWLNSSYIIQKNLCKFLESSNKDKLKILNNLAFNGSDIKSHKLKIETHLKNLQKNLEILKITYEHAQSDFNSKLNQNYNPNYTLENLNEAQKLLENAKTMILQYTELTKIEEHKKGQKYILTQELQKIPVINHVKTPEDYIYSDISSLNNKIIELEEKLTLLQNNQKLNQELIKIKINEKLPSLEFSLDDYNLAKEQEFMHQTQYLPLSHKIELMKNNIIVANFSSEKITHAKILEVKNQEAKYAEKLQILNKLKIYQDLPLEYQNLKITWPEYYKILEQQANYNTKYLPLQKLIAENNLENVEILVTSELIYTVQQAEKSYQEYLTLLPSLTFVDEENGWSIEQQQNLIQQHYILNENQQIKQKLDQLLLSIGTYRYAGELNPQIIENFKTQEKQYLFEQEILKECPKINATNLAQNLHNLELEIIYWKHQSLIVEYLNLTQAQTNFKLSYEEIYQLIQDLKISQNSLTCPHCQNKVLYQAQKLVKVNCLNNPYDLATLEKALQQVKRQTELKNLLDTLALDYLTFQPTLKNLSETQNKLTKLQKLTFMANPNVNTTLLPLIYQYRELLKNLKEVENPKYTVEQGQLLLKLNGLVKTSPKYSSLYLQNLKKFQDNLKFLTEYQNLGYHKEITYDSTLLKQSIEYQELLIELQKYEVEKVPYSSLELEKYYEYTLKVKELNNLSKYANLPSYSSSLIMEIIENNQKLQEIAKLIKLGANPSTCECEEAEILKFSNLKTQLINFKKYQEYLAKVELLNTQIKNIVLDPNVEIQLKYFKDLENYYLELIKNINYSLEMKLKHQNLLNLYQQLSELCLDIASTHDLYKDAIKIENEHLQATIDNLNRNLHKIYENLYEDSIRVKLCLTKKLKSKKNVEKNEVNLNVKYKNAEYAKIGHLSGGELARLSFGFMIALSAMSSSNLLLLDEIFESVDEDNREVCIETLRKFLHKKTIIVVAHSAVEGWYDKTLNF